MPPKQRQQSSDRRKHTLPKQTRAIAFAKPCACHSKVPSDSSHSTPSRPQRRHGRSPGVGLLFNARPEPSGDPFLNTAAEAVHGFHRTLAGPASVRARLCRRVARGGAHSASAACTTSTRVGCVHNKHTCSHVRPDTPRTRAPSITQNTIPWISGRRKGATSQQTRDMRKAPSATSPTFLEQSEYSILGQPRLRQSLQQLQAAAAAAAG